MARDRNDEHIMEYALELLPSRRSMEELGRAFGISSDRLTREGWQAQDLLDTRAMRDGVIDTWPHYLHMSVLFVSLPGGMQTARQLKELVRGNGRLRAFFEGLREVSLQAEFCSEPFQTRNGAFLCVLDRVGSAGFIQLINRIQNDIGQLIAEQELGNVREVATPEMLHLTLRGAWLRGGRQAEAQLEQHQLQFGRSIRPIRLEFDQWAITPWPRDQSARRRRFPSGWAAFWPTASKGKGKGKGKPGAKGKGKGKWNA